MRTFTPRADIVAIESGYQVEVELPGVSSENLSVELEQGVLSLRGQTGGTASESGEKPRIEPIAYERSFRLSEAVEGDRIQAELKNGLLTLTLPKAARALPRQIPVELN
jgi:HSP20 family molecular chaperone IbpA